MFKRVLLPIDLNEESSWKRALPVAVAQCRVSGGKLHLVAVVPNFGSPLVAQQFPADYEKKAGAQAESALKEIAAKNVPKDIKTSVTVGHGTIYEEILKAAKAAKCDLIVMAAHRPALKDYLLGPNAARVVRHAHCSVMVVRD